MNLYHAYRSKFKGTAIAKHKRGKKHSGQRRPEHSWNNLGLALTLVPMMFGVGLILAWAFDIYIFGKNESQPLLGFLFILIGFAASNALQKNRRLAIGWSLIAAADVIILIWIQFWPVMFAVSIGLAGAGFLISGFLQRWREDQAKSS